MLRFHILVPALLLFSMVLPLPASAQEGDQSEDTASQADGADQSSAQNKLQENHQELTKQQQELKALDEKIKQLSEKHQSATNQAELAADQLARLSQELRSAELQLDQTFLNISVTQSDVETIEQDITKLQQRISGNRDNLRDTVRALYEHERISFLDVILNDQTLGQLMDERRVYEELQQQTLGLINGLREQQQVLIDQQKELQQQQETLQQLKEVQSYQQAELKEQQQEKDNFAKLKKEEQASYQRQLAATKETRQEIEQQIFRLQGVGLELDLTDAFTAARYASSLTGVRPELLLGIIKVETNVGAWIGSGSFPDDMHPKSRDAFLRITSKLGLDPATSPISRRPTNIQGWGGAMGPGQIMPATWEGIEGRVAGLMNKPQPNPYELADALVGVGVMLADRGAANPNEELEAVGRYIAGPNWRYHMWYVNRVLAVTAEYAKEDLG